jgi:hypothetical protein
MNDGMYTNIRNYLQAIESNQGQILAELKRTNELLATMAKPVEAAPKPAAKKVAAKKGA